MKIRLTKEIYGGEGCFQPGDEAELSEAMATALIDIGAAISLEAPKPKTRKKVPAPAAPVVIPPVIEKEAVAVKAQGRKGK